MQTVSSNFTVASKRAIRSPISKIEVAWNRLSYQDESARVLSVELDRYLDGPVYTIARAILNVVLDNNSGRYTPNGGSAIDQFIKIGRYVRAWFGFRMGNTYEYVQLFQGIFDERPAIRNKGKQITFHALDSAWELWDKTVKNTEIFTNTRADIVIEALLTEQGITSGQMSLEAGANIIPFVYFEKGDNVGNIIKKLCEAEMGRFFVDETGTYIFQSRDSLNRAPYTSVVETILDDMVIDEVEPDYSTVINAIEIVGFPREVQANQFLYSQEIAKEIPAGGTVTIFANFNDPITSLTTPTSGGSTSNFKAGYTNDPNDETATAQVTLSSIDVFSKAAKLVFANADTDNPVFLTKLDLWGTPAKIINGGEGIQVRVTDEDSIDDNGEKLLRIENNYIQSVGYAESYAQTILEDRKDPSDYLRLTIRGLPQLQIGDRVARNGVEYNIVRQKIKLMASTGLVQELTLVSRAIETYFRIGISTIGGPDRIGP